MVVGQTNFTTISYSHAMDNNQRVKRMARENRKHLGSSQSVFEQPQTSSIALTIFCISSACATNHDEIYIQKGFEKGLF